MKLPNLWTILGWILVIFVGLIFISVFLAFLLGFLTGLFGGP